MGAARPLSRRPGPRFTTPVTPPSPGCDTTRQLGATSCTFSGRNRRFAPAIRCIFFSNPSWPAGLAGSGPPAAHGDGVRRMTRARVSVVGAALLGVWMAASTGLADRGQSPRRRSRPLPQRPPRPHRPVSRIGPPPRRRPPRMRSRRRCRPREQSDLVKTYCATCHSERAKAGGLSLAGFDAMKAARAAGRRREDDPQAAARA